MSGKRSNVDRSTVGSNITTLSNYGNGGGVSEGSGSIGIGIVSTSPGGVGGSSWPASRVGIGVEVSSLGGSNGSNEDKSAQNDLQRKNIIVTVSSSLSHRTEIITEKEVQTNLHVDWIWSGLLGVLRD